MDPQVHVLILSGYSLFAEGIASRLQQYPDQVNVQVMDPRQPSTFSTITETNPSVIMLDAADHETMQLCPLKELLFTLPHLKVMRLDSQKEMIQVVSSEQFRVVDADDLIQVITSVGITPEINKSEHDI